MEPTDVRDGGDAAPFVRQEGRLSLPSAPVRGSTWPLSAWWVRRATIGAPDDGREFWNSQLKLNRCGLAVGQVADLAARTLGDERNCRPHLQRQEPDKADLACYFGITPASIREAHNASSRLWRQ